MKNIVDIIQSTLRPDGMQEILSQLRASFNSYFVSEDQIMPVCMCCCCESSCC